MMNKNKKFINRIFSLVLALVLLTSQAGLLCIAAVDAYAQPVDSSDEPAEDANTVYINNAAQFAVLAQQCKSQAYSTGKVISLQADLDLSAMPNTTIPYMDGAFLGNGHTIKGLVFDESVADYALFRYIGKNGYVAELEVEATVLGDEEQKHVGIVAGNNAGVIKDCTSLGCINGFNQTGGIAGINELTGVISNCTNEATVDGKYQTGGIVGLNQGRVTECVNEGTINKNAKIKKNSKNNDSEAVNISIPNAVTGFAADERANETGGIAGYNEGSILFCTNSATVGYKELGSFTGGIAGRSSGYLAGDENSAAIYGRQYVGGIVGYLDPDSIKSLDRDYYKEIKAEIDTMESAFDGLIESGRQLKNDTFINAEAVSELVKQLKHTVRNYSDAYDADIDSTRGQLKKQSDEIMDTVDDINLNFRLSKIADSIEQIKNDIEEIKELIKKLGDNVSALDGNDKKEALELIEKYQRYIDDSNKLLAEIENTVPTLMTEETDGIDIENSSPDTENKENDTELENIDIEENADEMDAVDYENRKSANAPAPDKSALMDRSEYEKIVKRLEELISDIRDQFDIISESIDKWPKKVKKIKKQLRDLRKNSRNVIETTRDLTDRIDSRTHQFKAEIREQGDDLERELDNTREILDNDFERIIQNFEIFQNSANRINGIIADGYDDIKRVIEDKTVYIDVSDTMKSSSEKGSVASCSNNGEINGVKMIGGIVGAVSISEVKDSAVTVFEELKFKDDENLDFDDEEDEVNGITKHVQALIYDCINKGDSNADSEFAGGIVGKADYGKIEGCQSFCDVAAQDGKYAGIIAGYSKLSINNSYAYGGVSGKAFIGGIAGRGNNIKNCYTNTFIDNPANENGSYGAIAGKAKGTVSGNYFVDNGFGAVNGVTKIDEASELTYSELIALGNIPPEFQNFTVRFIDGDNVIWSGDFKYGDVFEKDAFPKLSNKDGEYANWENKTISPVVRNVTIHSIRRVFIPSIAAATDDNKPSNIIFSGMFYPDSVLLVNECSDDIKNKASAAKDSVNSDIHYMVTKVYEYSISQNEIFHPDMNIRMKRGILPINTAIILNRDFVPVTGMIYGKNIGNYLSIDAKVPQSGYIVVIEHISKKTVAASVLILFIIVGLCVIIQIIIKKIKKKRKNKQ